MRVTSFHFNVDAVVIEVPHGDRLAEVGKALGGWRDEAHRLATDMARLYKDGVFLDQDDLTPVVPGWQRRTRGDRRPAWYLVWPRDYAHRTGRKRWQYVEPDDVEATQRKVWRTHEYANLKVRHARLTRRIERVGRGLVRLMEASAQ